MVRDTALRTKGSGDPSGVDATWVPVNFCVKVIQELLIASEPQ